VVDFPKDYQPHLQVSITFFKNKYRKTTCRIRFAVVIFPKQTQRRQTMKIEEIRKQAGLNQQTMAQEVGVSLQTISNWETAGKTLDQLRPLARMGVERFARQHKIAINV
jgi:DNA-binding XRE family transcriptional regulator